MNNYAIEPFGKAEYDLLCRFVDGVGANFEALSLQLDSLRYRSALFRCPKLFGISVRSMSIVRRGHSIKFNVAWGYGAEDFRLGERRRIVLNDVVGLLVDGTNLRSELVIESGLLKELRLADNGLNSKQNPRENPRSIFRHQLTGFNYIGPRQNDLDAASQPGNRRQLSTPFEPLVIAAERLTQLQRWVLSLDAVAIHLSDRQLPLRLRRARPASQQEIEAFEVDNGVSIPRELKELWSLTNGCSFFRETVRGTYDSNVVRDEKRQMIVLADSEDFENYHVTIKNRESNLPLSDRNYIVSYEDWGTMETIQEWRSLNDCMHALLQRRL
jgi:hypothetical protein